jgi:galactokinase
LACADLVTFGALVDRSQQGAEEGLDNQVEETIALHRLARERGAVAASAFGAGFGGAVWAMVSRDEAERFTAVWREDYLRHFPQHALASRWAVTAPSAPAGFADL